MRSNSAFPFLRNPAWSPDGRLIAVVKGTGGIAGEIWLQPADGGPGRRAIEEPSAVFSDSPVFTARWRRHHSRLESWRRDEHLDAAARAATPLSASRPVRARTNPPASRRTEPSPSSTPAGGTRSTFAITRMARRARSLTHAPFLWGPASLSERPGGRLQPKRGGRLVARLGDRPRGRDRAAVDLR